MKIAHAFVFSLPVTLNYNIILTKNVRQNIWSGYLRMVETIKKNVRTWHRREEAETTRAEEYGITNGSLGHTELP